MIETIILYRDASGAEFARILRNDGTRVDGKVLLAYRLSPAQRARAIAMLE